jgi:hypothetical protein
MTRKEFEMWCNEHCPGTGDFDRHMNPSLSGKYRKRDCMECVWELLCLELSKAFDNMERDRLL